MSVGFDLLARLDGQLAKAGPKKGAFLVQRPKLATVTAKNLWISKPVPRLAVKIFRDTADGLDAFAHAEAGSTRRFAPRWHHPTRCIGLGTYRSEVLRRNAGEVERACRRRHEGERQREHRELRRA